jgi:hemerythrin
LRKELMDIIEWNARYEIGLEEIDKQHCELAKHINSLHEAIRGHSPKKAKVKVLDDVVSYTQFHFKYEEELMEKNNYRDSVRHKSEHEKLMSTLEVNKEQFLKLGHELDKELTNVLKKWFLDHTQNTDRRYLPFIRN